MRKSGISVAVLAAGTWLTLAAPCHAQIAASVTESGKLVYVNGDSPKPRHRSTISSGTGDTSALLKASRSFWAVPPAGTPVVDGQLERIVREAAERHSLDPALVKAVIRTESGWNPRAVSRKGAIGLMQLIPGTAERFGVGNPYDPVQNVEAGTSYLRTLLNRYNGDLTKSLAAYNAGERAVDQSNGVPAIPETRRYVKKVTDAYFEPDSDHDPEFEIRRRYRVRREVDPAGRVIYTNE